MKNEVRESAEIYLPFSKVNPAPYNPRRSLKPGDRAYEDIKRSIKEFGIVDPLVYNTRSGNLVGGHQRLTVLKDMGVEGSRFRTVDLPPAKEKALNIALNRISGEWDDSKLEELLTELDPSNLLLTGFNAEDLKEIQSVDELEEDDDQKRERWIFPPDDVVDEAVKYFRRAGFPYPKLELFEMKQQINKIAAMSPDSCLRSVTGYKIADTYNPHRFHAAAIGLKSPVAGFAKDKNLRIACQMEMDSGGIQKGLGTINVTSGVGPCSNFRPAFAKMIWEKYGGKGGVCFDPSMGYGGRLVGFLASPCGTYIATDPNVPTFEGNKKLAADLSRGRVIHLFNKPVEDLDITRFVGKADIAFTSPPYFLKEVYSTDKTQSRERYPTYEGWLDGFLTKMIAKCFTILKPGGHFVLNIEDVKIKGKDFALVEPSVVRAKAAGFEEIGRQKFGIPKNLHNSKKDETGEFDQDQDTDESVLVFRKPKRGGK